MLEVDGRPFNPSSVDLPSRVVKATDAPDTGSTFPARGLRVAGDARPELVVMAPPNLPHRPTAVLTYLRLPVPERQPIEGSQPSSIAAEPASPQHVFDRLS